MKPPESFVPLTAAPASPSAREFRVAIINGHNHAPGHDAGAGSAQDHRNREASGAGAAQATGFQSLDSQRLASLTNANGTEKKIGEPRVSVQRDGDRVTHLRIQCTCGQILDLACVYDAPSAAQSP